MVHTHLTNPSFHNMKPVGVLPTFCMQITILLGGEKQCVPKVSFPSTKPNNQGRT